MYMIYLKNQPDHGTTHNQKHGSRQKQYNNKHTHNIYIICVQHILNMFKKTTL